ncbi:MAG: DUF2225 domain-containing protein [Lachnospiraceae bacterium]
MNLLSGLEKFGLNLGEKMNLFEDDSQKTNSDENGENQEEKIPTEDEFLLEKTVQCRICDKNFKAKMLKNGRAKRLEPDDDLRPRHQYIDTLKYDVVSCPYCGYTAMNRYFEHLTSMQAKLIKDEVCSKFKGTGEQKEEASYSYEEAIDRYKLALFNTIVKKGKTSEKAYTCLKISWLLRGKAEELPNKTEEDKKNLLECKQEEEAFYEQAYEGLLKATASEMYPICGMEQSTLDYLLAQMAFHFNKLDVASRFVSGILTSQAANRRMKDKALDLKDKILAQIRSSKS